MEEETSLGYAIYEAVSVAMLNIGMKNQCFKTISDSF